MLVKLFLKVLSKAFDLEAAGREKKLIAERPSGDDLLEKARDEVLDFSLKSSIVEIGPS